MLHFCFLSFFLSLFLFLFSFSMTLKGEEILISVLGMLVIPLIIFVLACLIIYVQNSKLQHFSLF